MTDSSTKDNEDHSGTGFQKVMFYYFFVMSSQEFENDLSEFNQRVEDLDQRLGTIFLQAFDDTPDVEHAFKVCTRETGAIPMLDASLALTRGC